MFNYHINLKVLGSQRNYIIQADNPKAEARHGNEKNTSVGERGHRHHG